MKPRVAPDSVSPSPARVLQRGLSERRGRPVRIPATESGPLGGFSSHPIHRLRATLDTGETLSTIFKRVQPGEDGRGNEVLVYRRLLSGCRFGAPDLYAHLHDEERGLYWLFLEDLDGWKLEWCETRVWPAAFRWMARMHAGRLGRERELHAANCLLDHGPRFYRALAAAARRTLRERGEARALARFDALTGRWFEGTVTYLRSRPRTLVHGDASCHNLVVERPEDPGSPVRPLDWEWAAVGVGAWDVAKLLSGWGAEKRMLLEAYLGEFGRHGPLDREAFGRELGHCRALHALWYLRWWVRGCEEPAFVERLLDKVERIWRTDGVIDGG